ncbi:MAG: cobalt ECF transporter T component CbiQ [Bryobacteraceae bacterium]
MTASKGGRRSVLEKTLAEILSTVERAEEANRSAQGAGFLQGFDPRVKLVGLLLLIVAAASGNQFNALCALLAAGIVLAFLSRIRLRQMAGAWVGALLFSGAIALPAVFLTPGPALLHLPITGWALTTTGLRSAAFLTLRAETTVTLSFLLVYTTPSTHLLKALRSLRVPVTVVVLAGMTYRYIFVLLQTALEMIESRRSRIVGQMEAADRRRLLVSSAGVLLGKSFQLSNDVFLAMQSRGYRGEVYLLDEFNWRGRDWVGLAGFAVAGALALVGGR